MWRYYRQRTDLEYVFEGIPISTLSKSTTDPGEHFGDTACDNFKTQLQLAVEALNIDNLPEQILLKAYRIYVLH